MQILLLSGDTGTIGEVIMLVGTVTTLVLLSDPAVSAGVAEIDVPEAEYATAWDQTT